MQIVVKTLDNLARQMVVTIPPDQVAQEIKNALSQATRTASIDGFRPGKVPLSFITEKFGKQIEIDSLERIARSLIPKAFTQENIQYPIQPTINLQAYQAGQPWSFEVNYEELPAIALKPFNDLIIEKAESAITDTDVAETLEGMRKQKQQWQAVNRAAEDGDRVVIDFIGKIDAQEFAGGKAQDFSLTLGAGQMIPGFESGIVGHQVGETFIIDVAFPDNYHSKDLAGKAANFEITLQKIEAGELPALDDAFVEQFGLPQNNLDALREEIKNTLIRQCDMALKQQCKQEVMEKLKQSYQEILIPSALIGHAIQELRQQAEQKFKDFGRKAPHLADHLFTDRARDRVLLSLILDEMIKQYHLKPDANKVRQIVGELAQRFDEAKAQNVIEWYYQDKKRLAEIENLALEEQIVDLVLAEATIVEKFIPMRELLKPEGV